MILWVHEVHEAQFAILSPFLKINESVSTYQRSFLLVTYGRPATKPEARESGPVGSRAGLSLQEGASPRPLAEMSPMRLCCFFCQYVEFCNPFNQMRKNNLYIINVFSLNKQSSLLLLNFFPKCKSFYNGCVCYSISQ